MSTPTSPMNGNPGRTSAADADFEAHAQAVTKTDAPVALPTPPGLGKPAASPIHGTGADTTNDSPRVTPRESQHEARRGDPLSPLYADPEVLSYSGDSNPESATLARYFFIFGFLFPPLWALGAITFVFPLAAPGDLQSTKSEAERQELLYATRVIELKWAQRCAWALFVLFVLAGVAVAIAFAVFHQ